jgi:hypothetical protein
MTRSFAIFVLFGVIAPVAQAASPTHDELLQWLRALDSEEYAVREAATRQLIAAGPIAIDALAAGVNSDSPETAWRASEALQQIAIEGDEATLAGVTAALAQLQKSGRPGIEKLVRDLRIRQARLRHDRAAARLQSLGAKLSGDELVAMGLAPGFAGGFAVLDLGGDVIVDATAIEIDVMPLAEVEGVEVDTAIEEAPEKSIPLKALESTLERLASLSEPPDLGEAAELNPDLEIAGETAAEAAPVDVEPPPTTVEPLRSVATEASVPDSSIAQVEEAPPDPAPPAVEAPLEEPLVDDPHAADVGFIGEAFVGEVETEPVAPGMTQALILDKDWRGGDEALRALADLPGIWRLSIQDADVSDAALTYVAALPKLQQLEISGGRFTAKSLFGMRKKRPEVRILARGPAMLGVHSDVDGPCILTGVYAVDGHPVASFSDLTIAVYARRPGDALKVEVVREGGEAPESVEVQLTDRRVLEP